MHLANIRTVLSERDLAAHGTTLLFGQPQVNARLIVLMTTLQFLYALSYTKIFHADMACILTGQSPVPAPSEDLVNLFLAVTSVYMASVLLHL